MEAYLSKRYGAVKDSFDLKPKKAKKKKKKKDPAPASAGKGKFQGVMIVDDDAEWQKKLNDSDEGEEEAPTIVEEDDEVTRVKRMDLLRRRTYLAIGDDGSGWVDVTSGKKCADDLSPARGPRRARLDTPDHSPAREDLSPPRRTRQDTPDGTPAREDLSPPRRSRSREDLSPPRRRRDQEDLTPPRRTRQGTPDLSPARRSRGGGSPARGGDEDLSPPRRTDLSPPRRSRQAELQQDLSPLRRRDASESPPRRRRSQAEAEDLSPPRRRRRRGSESPRGRNQAEEVVDLSPPRRRQRRDTEDLSPPRRSKAGGDDLSPPRRRQRTDTEDLSPPRRRSGSDLSPRRKAGAGDLSPPRHRPRTDTSPPRRREDLSPPRRRSGSDLSPPRRKAGGSDLSPPRRRQRTDTEDLSPPRRKSGRDLSPPRRKGGGGDLSPRRSRGEDLSPPHRRSTSDLSPPRRGRVDDASDKAKAGLKTGSELRHEITEKQSQDARRFKQLDSTLTGRGAETVYRDKHGRRLAGLEELMKQQKGPAKEPEKPLEWGTGLAQKREAEKRREEIEAEKDKPFARSKDDLDAIYKNRVRWGDPMAHLVKQTDEVLLGLEDFGRSDKMRESGFNVPQGVPAHSWLKRGHAATPNRYNIRPGRHWDGVDRSNGFEEKLFKQQNEKKAMVDTAYLWSVADM
ncbi:BUD13 homolog [Selaginella moellendorffii]|uniref:BUD13 homolog n=1 Tax=Selaginella moellendorffii TaxID=88036 RepID=UPI000D1C5992|nr:BUD13 homolog [Selaginella moellendorffii]|eukprot:XP_024529437.1 BUD13 homolog [Selaginella moellendorffii]